MHRHAATAGLRCGHCYSNIIQRIGAACRRVAACVWRMGNADEPLLTVFLQTAIQAAMHQRPDENRYGRINIEDERIMAGGRYQPAEMEDHSQCWSVLRWRQ